MKDSIYNIWLKKSSDSSLCFNSSTGGFAELDEKTLKLMHKATQDKDFNPETLNDEESKNIAELKRGSIIVDDTVDELERLKFRYTKSTFSEHGIGMTILPTLRCNCDCVYCFEENKNSDMPDEVVAGVKSYIEKKLESGGKKHIGISWFGGEPLLEFNIIRDITDHVVKIADEQNVKKYFSVVSNGLLLNKEMCSYFKDINLGRMQITLDGPKDIHDKRRILKGGAGTFDKIIEKILMAQEYFHVNIRVNIDKHISERIDDLFEDLRPLLKKNVSIYPAQLQDGMTQACSSVETSCYNVKDFALFAKDFIVDANKMGFPFSWAPKPKFCSCGETSVSSLVVQPNGDLCLCWNQVGVDEEKFGNILEDGKAFDGRNYYKWRLYNPFEIEECRKCVYLPLCLGGCPAMRIIPTSEFLYNKGEGRCSEHKYNMKQLLEYIYQRKTGYRQTS